MLNSLLSFSYYLCITNELMPRSQKRLWQKLYYNGMKIVCIIAIQTLLKIKYLFKKQPFEPLIDDGNKPIVSLTTFPARIDTVWLVIHSIYNQSYRPAKILIVLTKEEFPEGIKSVPSSLNRYLNKGVEIVFTNENLKPHNKYHYALRTYPNRIVITVDDDLFYWKDTIERLVKLHIQYAECVCANRIQRISIEDDKFDKSFNWKTMEHKVEPSHQYLALGYSAVLYPNNFQNSLLLDDRKIKAYCLNADDLWLKCCEILNKTMVVAGAYYPHPLMLLFSQKVALRFSNDDILNPKNDLQWDNLNREFNLLSILKEDQI